MSISRACRSVSLSRDPLAPWSDAPWLLTRYGQGLPIIDERLYLRLWLPPFIGRRLCTFVGKTSKLELLPSQVEISARDLLNQCQKEVTKGDGDGRLRGLTWIL